MSSIQKFTPFHELERMSNQIERQINSLLGTDFFGGTNVQQFFDEVVRNRAFTPHVDVSEDAGAVYIQVELAGLQKQDVEVTVSDDRILTIKGERKNEFKEEGKTYVRTERSFGTFTRSFELPANVESSNVQATFDNGVLHLTIPKTEEIKPKQIAVEIK